MILRVMCGVLASIILLLCGCTSTKSVAPLNVALEEDYIPLQEEVWAIAQADSLHETLLLARKVPSGRIARGTPAVLITKSQPARMS